MYETYVTIQGNVATPIRSGLSRSGSPYASFRLASTVRRETAEGWRDVGTSFYQVSCYRYLAEHVVASLQIGHPVVVYGKQQIKQWEKGEKQGTDADVEAIAVGHDLNRGTSMFVRHGRRRVAEPEGGVPGEPAASAARPAPEAAASAEAVSAA